MIDPDVLSSQSDVIQQEQEGAGEMRFPGQLIHRGGSCGMTAGRGGRSELADEVYKQKQT